jgi:putative (di)nucleoside polyphosphate hydrolase
MTIEPEAYRPCAGAMLINRDGLIFVARRIDTPGDAWQMPQGGIDDGEMPREAALRELKEETGTGRAEIIAESRFWYDYDLPDELMGRMWQGRYRGQRMKWFAMRFIGDDCDIDLNAGETPEFNAWQWVPVDQVPLLIVEFKRRLYWEVVAEFQHLAVPSNGLS